MITLKDVISQAREYQYMKSVEREKERVKKTSEIFTPTAVVMKMCDDYAFNHDSEWDGDMCDNACGDGQILSELLLRKVLFYKNIPIDEMNSYSDVEIVPDFFYRAIDEVYGVEKMHDNVIACRKRLGCGIIDDNGEIAAGYENYRNSYKSIMKNIEEGDWLEIYDYYVMSKTTAIRLLI